MSQDRITLKSLTLVELLVAIGVAVILIAAGAPLFKQTAARQEALVGDANLVISILEEARNLAVHPESKDAASYSVVLPTPNQSGGRDVLRIIRDGDPSQIISEVTLPNSKIQASPLPVVKFALFSGEYVGLPETLTLYLKVDPSKSRAVNVISPGAIYVATPTP